MLGSIGRKTFSRIGFEIADAIVRHLFGMRVVQREVERREGELAPIKNAGGRQFRVLHFLDYFRRNLLRWIAVIGRESVEHFLVPDPVLQHLRWRLDKIARHMRAGETAVLRASHDRVQRVAEFVEQRFDILVGQQATACPLSAAENCRATRRSAADIFHPATVCRR